MINTLSPPPPPPPPKPKPKKPVEPPPATPKSKREGRSSSFQAQKASPTRRESKSTSFKAAPTAKAARAKSPSAALDAVNAAKHDYDGAKKKVDSLNGRLTTELHKLQPALTKQQTQTYIEKFHARYQKDYAAETNDSKRLAGALLDPMLNKAAAQNVVAAHDAAEAAKSLAKSSRGADALRWTAQAFSKSNPARENYLKIEKPIFGLGDGVNVEKDVVEPSLSTAAGQMIAEHKGDVSAAISGYQNLVGQVQNVGFGGKGVKDGLALVSKVEQAVATGSATGLKARAFVDAADEGPGGKGLAGASLAFAAFGLAGAGGQNFAQLSQNIANTGRAGVELLTTALGTLNTAGKVAGPDGLRSVQFLDRLAPGIGIVANALALGIDAGSFANDPSVGGAITVAGDTISLVGSAVGTVLPGVGQLIEGAGALVSGLGSLLTGQQQKHEVDAEEQKLLVASGVNAKAAGTLANGDDEPAQLQKQLAMQPEQIQQLAQQHPEVWAAKGYAQGVIDAVRASGVRGKDVEGFVDALKKDDPQYVNFLFAQYENRGTNQPVHDETLRQVVATKFKDAAAFARAHAPGTYGASAEQRQKADRDLQLAGLEPESIGNLLKSNTDAGYQAEVIKQLKDRGALQNWVTQIGRNWHYNGWPEASAAAIRNAQRTGVLSATDAKRYLSEIGA